MTRFDEFEERKTSEARAATMAPFVTDVDHGRPDGSDGRPRDLHCIELGNEWSRTMFDGPFYLSPSTADDLPSTNLVFVQSRDGNTATNDPSTLGGGEADTHLIYEGLSRVAADAVLAGARTVRSGNLVLSVWRPELVALRASMGLPRHPVQVVATLQGLPLDEGLMFNVPELRLILITAARAADAMREALKARPWITLVVMNDPLDWRNAFRELRRVGIERMSCIGGRTLAGPLLDAGLVQDVYLTTGTKAGGEPGTPFYAKPLNGREIVRKHGTGPDRGVIFEHRQLF
jgi:riboflavin biosynthesis pyrimidine reductase